MAVFPLTPGPTPPAHPDYSGKLIPQLWSKKLLERFYDATVLNAISTTEYEGEIKNYGDTVIINKIPDITISNYRWRLGLSRGKRSMPAMNNGWRRYRR